jgi:hypothetical protein
LKRFLRPERPTIFHFRVERDDGLVEARLETQDEETVRSAIAAVAQLAQPAKRFVWDIESGEWKMLE